MQVTDSDKLVPIVEDLSFKQTGQYQVSRRSVTGQLLTWLKSGSWWTSPCNWCVYRCVTRYYFPHRLHIFRSTRVCRYAAVTVKNENIWMSLRWLGAVQVFTPPPLKIVLFCEMWQLSQSLMERLYDCCCTFSPVWRCYLQSLGVSVLVLLLLEQLLNVCLQFLHMCVCFLLKSHVSSLLFLQTLFQTLKLIILNAQLCFLQQHTW